MTANRDSLEVVSGVLPLDLRFCETAIKDLAKISSKHLTAPIKQQLELYLLRDHPSSRTPLGKCLELTKLMERDCKFSLLQVEEEPTFEPGCLMQPSISAVLTLIRTVAVSHGVYFCLYLTKHCGLL